MTPKSSLRPIPFPAVGVPFHSMKLWKIVACLIPITLGTSIALAVQAEHLGPRDGVRTVTFHGRDHGGQAAALSAWLDWCAQGDHRVTNPVGCVLSWTL